MKNFIIIFTLCYFLTSSCPAKCDFFINPLGVILSYVWGPSNNLEYQELPTGGIVDDLDSEYRFDPLILTVVNYDNVLKMAGIVNPELLGQIIRDEVFLDILFICPKAPNDGKKVPAKSNDNETTQPSLVITKEFTSLLDEREKQRNQATGETNEKEDSEHDKMEVDSDSIPNSAQSHPAEKEDNKSSNPENKSYVQLLNPHAAFIRHKIGLVSNLIQNSIYALTMNKGEENKSPRAEQLESQNDASGHDAMGVDSNSTPNAIQANPTNKKQENTSPSAPQSEPQNDALGHDDAGADSNSTSNAIQANSTNKEEETTSPSAQQTEPQKDAPSHDKTDSDSGSNKKETKSSPAQQPESQKDKPSDKFIQIKHKLTIETEKDWMEAVNDVKKIKCRAPILGPTKFFEYTEKKLKFKYFIAGFQVYMENYENLIDDNYGFSSKTDKFFWTLTVVFDAAKMRVICVFQGSHYNKDLYSPDINDSFDNHDLGKEEMFPQMDVASFYDEANQRKVLNKNYFDPKQNKKLVKVHLAPLHSFITPMVRQSAKMYGNVSAMWSTIRIGAWRKVEDYINVITHALIDLVVITGTYQTLTLDNQEIYLAGDKLPVPLIFWKLVLSAPSTKRCAGMFIVTVNNPYEKVDDMICEEDECERYGWEYIQEKDYTKGRTICCAYTEKIAKALDVVSGFEPKETAILTIDRVSQSISETWQFDESGQPTTFGERFEIARKLRPSLSEDSVKRKLAELGDTMTPEEELRMKKGQ